MATPPFDSVPIDPTSATSTILPRTAVRPLRNFYIEPPHLPLAQKEQYKLMPESSLTSEVEIQVDEVIGEYTEGCNLYYFARCQGGIAHKFPSVPFLKKYADLVDDYKSKKTKGTLQPFDPSAHYIHPLSRVRMIVNISNNRATVNISSARSLKKKDDSIDIVPESQSEKEDESASEQDSYDDDDDDQHIKPRQTRRTTAKMGKKLLFSPKKTRSQRVFVVESDVEDGSDDELLTAPVTRRSTRARNGVKIKFDTETYQEDSEVDDEGSNFESANESNTKGKKKRKIVRGRASRSAYGHFRSVADLDYDSHSDEESVLLRAHRSMCEKCHRGPAHDLAAEILGKSNNGRKKKKTTDDEFEESGDEQEKAVALGGWVRCLKCPVVAHWQCLASTQRDEILKAARDKDRVEWERAHGMKDQTSTSQITKALPLKRLGLDAYQTTEFICGACMKGGICMGCMTTALEPDSSSQPKLGGVDVLGDKDVFMLDGTHHTTSLSPSDALQDETTTHTTPFERLFRCFTCKRLAHYEHLPVPPALDDKTTNPGEIAHYYQTKQSWLCGDCASYRYGLDKIIAWRPYPATAVEPPRSLDTPLHFKSPLPREYLVKWLDRSYKRVQWVPHMWLVSTNQAKLKNFLTGGSKVQLLAQQDISVPTHEEPAPLFEISADSRASSAKPGVTAISLTQDAVPDAEDRIPSAWKTVDRILDILLWHPRRQNGSTKRRTSKKSRKRMVRIDSEDTDEESEVVNSEEINAVFNDGEQPSKSLTETVSEWEDRTGKTFGMKNIGRVVWAFIKWDEIGYDEATWDSPPRPQDVPGYSAYLTAMKRFVDSRHVTVPKLSKADSEKFDNRTKDEYRNVHALKEASQLDLGQNPQLKLMPFQVDGFNWLCNNWWTRQHCILADEMGLGKTVQITTFLGNIIANFQAFPALVVVPNSTITNWVREFERWAPNLRVVPFYGEAKARDVIRKFELRHESKRQGDTGAKFHVLITTYEALLNPKDFTPVFKNQPRWEVLVIDEGQRLKSDSSLLFKKLNELNSMHRIIMTGTPLNNNMRELFNLMNFLDPKEWHDLEALEKEHEELNEDLVKQLHNRLRPYFLRRIKSEVLQLPPKNEVIVPVSMAPLQKEVYRSILSHNLELLTGLTQPANSRLNGAGPKGRINNILMQLRKCLQHPYLYAEDIEPRGLPAQESHEKLIDASAKLRFLKVLLPKLKDRGHRVLLFSQFVIALDVIEDFLHGEGHRYLRLDGNTKGADRQKGMDEFNRPNSDIFIYLLTTRAGGVGINLFSADTVIIFDPDFNPHQDLQAIARAHRFGQQKTCLVFKLMVKDSAEERIVQVGKKKLVLDHLIVQKINDEDSAGENVQSILTYGAQALFEAEQGARDIIYTDYDIEKLIEKTEREGDQEEAAAGAMSFSFAKIWSADKDSLEEVKDDDQSDSWAQTLQKMTAEREKIQSREVLVSGRGARRAAAPTFKPSELDDGQISQLTPKKKSTLSDSSAYAGSDIESDDDASDADSEIATADDLTFQPRETLDPSHRKSKPTLKFSTSPSHRASNELHNSLTENIPLSPIHNNPESFSCGLCGKKHGDRAGDCLMTDRSENLAEFREMLLLHAEDEPWEQRCAAIRAIDETLYRRGDISLIAGQPLNPLPQSSVIPNMLPRKETKVKDTSQKRRNQAPQHYNAPTLSSSVTDSTNALVVPFGSSTLPQGSEFTHQTAGPSKRPTPFSVSLESHPKKKSRITLSSSPCPVCGQSPHHLIKECSLVTQGPASVSRQIKRLELDPNPGTANTVQILHSILKKQKKREMGVAEIIQISD